MIRGQPTSCVDCYILVERRRLASANSSSFHAISLMFIHSHTGIRATLSKAAAIKAPGSAALQQRTSAD